MSNIVLRSGTYLSLFAYRFVNNIMIWHSLFLGSIEHILKTRTSLLEIDIAKSTIEERLARMKFELETQLIVINPSVAAKVEQCIVEIGQRFFKIA
jgi:hypothetical protein